MFYKKILISITVMFFLLVSIVSATPIMNNFSTSLDTINITYDITLINGTGEATLFFKPSGFNEFVVQEKRIITTSDDYSFFISGLEKNTLYDFYLLLEEDNKKSYSIIDTVETKQDNSFTSLIENNVALTFIFLLILFLLAVIIFGSQLLAGIIGLVATFIAFTYVGWLIAFIILIMTIITIFS